MSGTVIVYDASCLCVSWFCRKAYGAIGLRACYAMSGTDGACGQGKREGRREGERSGQREVWGRLQVSAYARPMQCPVLA
eukprot:2551526-Rhodomonas_salina.3